MTKVQKHFRLPRPLDEPMLTRIAGANSIYGIERVELAPARDAIMVEFDASRLRVPEVESALHRAGIPVEPIAA